MIVGLLAVGWGVYNLRQIVICAENNGVTVLGVAQLHCLNRDNLKEL